MGKKVDSSNGNTHITNDVLEKRDQLEKLLVVLVAKPRLNRDTII